MMYYGLLAFFVLEYVRLGNYIPGLNLLRLNSLVPLATVVGTLAMKTKYSNAEVFADTNARTIVALLGMILASFVVADVTMYAFETFTTVLGYSLIAFVIAKQVTEWWQIKGLFAVLIFVHLLLAALTPQMLLDPGTRHYIASGTFLGDGNDYALSVNLCIPMALFLMLDAPNFRTRLLTAVSLLFLVLCVVATQSRGGTLALGFVIAYYWWKSPKKMLTGAIAAVVVMTVLVFAPPAYFQRMNTISNYENDGSAQGRLIAWAAGTGMMMSNPLMGVGAGQFPANFTRFAPGDESRWKTAHSIYFLILGELGLPGLGLLLFFIFSNLAQNSRLVREIRGKPTPNTARQVQLLSCLSVAVIAYAIAGAFLSATYYPHMFVLAGLLLSSRRLVREESRATVAAVPTAALAPAARPALITQSLLGRQAVSKSLSTSPQSDDRFF